MMGLYCIAKAFELDQDEDEQHRDLDMENYISCGVPRMAVYLVYVASRNLQKQMDSKATSHRQLYIFQRTRNKSSIITFPIMLITTLGCVYQHYNEKSRISISERAENSFSSSPWIKVQSWLWLLWALLLELAFSVMFIFLMIWSLANYFYVSFGHLHMDKPGVQVYVTSFQELNDTPIVAIEVQKCIPES
ncbi:hypothetical protein M9H77_26676 [Catharanthus roseus]|uniref:Uncharacterized protein n=1 Tax=Catharanthus roseus TaxID=4058 RepID=A0ACC0AAD0_CATRO|nr:hypothetical protein M9H77_26676 [Catharanthus roseus]